MRKLIAILLIIFTIAITTPGEHHPSSDDTHRAIIHDDIVLHNDLPNQH